jgi:hypothetical protein
MDILSGEYRLLLPGGGSFVHERTFILLRTEPVLLIRDRVSGNGRHTVCSRFHFAPGIRVTASQDGIEGSHVNQSQFTLSQLGESFGEVTVSKGWTSKTYATKNDIQIVEIKNSCLLPMQQWFAIALQGARQNFGQIRRRVEMESGLK